MARLVRLVRLQIESEQDSDDQNHGTYDPLNSPVFLPPLPGTFDFAEENLLGRTEIPLGGLYLPNVLPNRVTCVLTHASYASKVYAKATNRWFVRFRPC